jgi:hypothetical protein
MAHPYHHALSSVKKWGGCVEDYQKIHDWFDASKEFIGDFRHRILRHHAQGIFECERVFGTTIKLSNGNEIPTRFVGEQHVNEDLGHIPSLNDWLKNLIPEPWMNKRTHLEESLNIKYNNIRGVLDKEVKKEEEVAST